MDEEERCETETEERRTEDFARDMGALLKGTATERFIQDEITLTASDGRPQCKMTTFSAVQQLDSTFDARASPFAIVFACGGDTKRLVNAPWAREHSYQLTQDPGTEEVLNPVTSGAVSVERADDGVAALGKPLTPDIRYDSDDLGNGVEDCPKKTKGPPRRKREVSPRPDLLGTATLRSTDPRKKRHPGSVVSPDVPLRTGPGSRERVSSPPSCFEGMASSSNTAEEIPEGGM